jgi:hypothetical protein
VAAALGAHHEQVIVVFQFFVFLLRLALYVMFSHLALSYFCLLRCFVIVLVFAYVFLHPLFLWVFFVLSLSVCCYSSQDKLYVQLDLMMRIYFFKQTLLVRVRIRVRVRVRLRIRILSIG